MIDDLFSLSGQNNLVIVPREKLFLDVMQQPIEVCIYSSWANKELHWRKAIQLFGEEFECNQELKFSEGVEIINIEKYDGGYWRNY